MPELFEVGSGLVESLYHLVRFREQPGMNFQIIQATIFQRLTSNHQGWLCGCLKLEGDNQCITPDALYAVSFTERQVTARAIMPLDSADVPVGLSNDLFLKLPVASNSRPADISGYFLARLAPLHGLDGWYSILAAVNGTVISEPQYRESTHDKPAGDCWYKMVGDQMAPISPLAQTSGENASTLQNLVLWDIEGQSYQIGFQHPKCYEIQAAIKSQYVLLLKNTRAIESIGVEDILRLIPAQGLSKCNLHGECKSLLSTIRDNSKYLMFLKKLHKEGLITNTNVMPEDRVQYRNTILKECIEG